LNQVNFKQHTPLNKTPFIYLSIILLYFYALNLSAQGNYKFEHIELPTEQIDQKARCILEDSKGFIWFGFDNGLVIYDGYKGKKISLVLETRNARNFPSVAALVEDTNGKIWIGTQNGVYIYNPIKETSVYLDDPKINGKSCRSLSTTSKGEILIGTQGDGLLIYNSEGVFLEQYSHQLSIENSLSNNVVRNTYEDKSGNIWIGTYDKLNLLNRKEKKISHFKLQLRDSVNHTNNLILSIKPFKKDNDSVLVIGTETGLCLFNIYDKTFEQFRHSENQNSISNSVVKSICKVDNQLWLGTDLGLNIFDYNKKIFSNYYHDFNNSNSISNNVIWDLYFDSHRNLWIASNAGIDKIYLNPNNILLNQFSNNASFFTGGISINSFAKQDKRNIWIATQQGVVKYDKNKNSYEQFLPPKILHSKVMDILYDKNGLVWIATSGGLNVYDTNKKVFLKYVSELKGKNVLTTNYLTTIAQDSKGTIWIGTITKGLFKVVRKNNGELEFINFKHETENDNSLGSNSIFDIAFDENDNVWIATSKGVNCFYNLNGVFERFTDINKYGEAPNESVFQLFFDKEKSLWLSSYSGLFKWNPKSNKFRRFENTPRNVTSAVTIDSTVYFTADNKFYYFDKTNNEVKRVLNNEIGLKHIKEINLIDDKTILLSGKTDFASLNVNDLNIKKDKVIVKWTNFSIGNTNINPITQYNSRTILDKNIDETEAIVLEYDENSFRIDFTSLSFNSQKDVEYKYILEGYEKDWSIIKDGQNYVYFTQVRPGTYKLKVKASNNQGLFNDNERTLNIKVEPPNYFSWWALLTYLICFVLLILFYRRVLLRRERDKNELKFEKLEHQKSDELIELKTRFFTNITHELKTPLTLISSPIDDLLTKELDETTLNSLSLVKQNTDRLKKLVNQILDIRKIEAGGEKLRIQEFDIVKFCNQIINQFKEESIKRNIFLQFSTEHESLNIWFDMEKVEKILFNLLSNAFKFTPNKGTIRIGLDLENGIKEEKDNYLSISVSDTGKGISKEDQVNIFDRFNSLSSPNYSNQKGTGIGLSLIYEYAALHNGSIKFESLLNVGSKFIFSLPTDKSLLKNHKITETLSEETPEDEIDYLGSLDEEFDDEKIKKTKLLKALIAEDDADMRDFLTTGLSTKYKVIQAEDGQEGFNVVLKELPDIIVSDLMMPNVDGIEFCKKLKADIRTSHIPFILLTAKSSMDSKLIGIETGADDYIQKPFNLEHLTVRMKNLINQRESLRKVFLQQQKLEPSEITVNSVDEKFLDDLLAKIETEMDNSDLSVKLLSQMLEISPTNLYRKIKALTGQTATEFIRNIRLKRAAQLFKNEHLNVSEVMYMVGFTHSSYFTRCFKELFGVSPKSYGK
jgi:signal transduction histidine kinase/ligand-binding sensor domain-containing protein/DNA-binding response OmpR family regulator